MAQGNHNIRIHDGTSDFGFLYIFPVNGDQHVIGSLKPVRNDHVAARGKRIIPVLICGVQMVQGILPAAHIQGVAVRQEHPAVLRLNQVHQDLGIVRPQVSQVAWLAKMDLYGRILVVEINIHHTGLLNQSLQLLQEIFL